MLWSSSGDAVVELDSRLRLRKHSSELAVTGHWFEYRIFVMWLKQCHKPPIWEWFIPFYITHKNGEVGDGL